LSAARHYSVRIAEGFVHAFAGGQDHPGQRVHTRGMGEGQGKRGTGRTCSVITLPDPNIRINPLRPPSIFNTILFAEIAID